MKIRAGYVSNSSTSSFVIIGILYPYENWKDAIKKIGIVDEEDFEYWAEGNGFVLIRGHSENDIPKGKMIVGTNYVQSDDSGNMDFHEISFSKAKEKLIEKGFEGEVVVITGTRL